MGDTFKIDLQLGGDQAPSAQSPSKMRLVIPPRQKVLNFADEIVAVFVETTGTITIATASGVIKRNTVTTTRTEQGAGKTMTRHHGAIIIVEQNDPAVAHSGYVTVLMTALLAVSTAEYQLTDGVALLVDAANVTADVSFVLDFGAAVNKKATLYLLGKVAA